MSPILGIIASSNQNQFISYTDYESIATVTVGAGGASSVTFSSIPSTYQHLQLRGLVRMNSAGSYPQMRLNGDTGSNYAAHLIYADGATVGSYGYGTSTFMDWMGGQSDGSSTGWSPVVTDFLDYQNTNKFKTLRSLGGIDMNGSGQVDLCSGLWRSTSAINTITIVAATSGFPQYTQYALYGIKG